MADWNNNNRACEITWLTLKVLGQNDESFAKSGKIEMRELNYWNSASTDELRKIQVNTLSIQMDNMFILTYKAKYEEGAGREKALTDITATMLDANKTIADLAKKNDDNYQFLFEHEEI